MPEVFVLNRIESDGYTYSCDILMGVFSSMELAEEAMLKRVQKQESLEVTWNAYNNENREGYEEWARSNRSDKATKKWRKTTEDIIKKYGNPRVPYGAKVDDYHIEKMEMDKIYDD